MGEIEYRSVVQPVLRWLNSLPGCKAINIHGSVYMERGTPDIIGCYKGRMFLFECKTDIGQLRPDQIIRLQQWRRSGAAAVEIRSLDQAKEILRGLGFVDVGKT
jgi:Holliday junction resolvase